MPSINFSAGFNAGLPNRLLRTDGDPWSSFYSPQKSGFLTVDNKSGSTPTFYIFSGTKQNIAYCKVNANSASLISNNLLVKFDRADLTSTTLTGNLLINFISIYKQATNLVQYDIHDIH